MNLILIIFLSVTIKTIHCPKLQIDAPLKLKNLICEYNETWVKHNTCTVKSHSRVKRTAEASAYLLQPVNKFHLVFNVFKRYSGWKPWVMYNIKINGCEFLAGKTNPYLNIIKHLFKKYTTFNHTCPYLPGLLQITGLDLRDLAIGALVIPSGEYRLDININLNSVINIAILKFTAEVWEKY